MVYPSGAERTSCALASVVPAPGLDSTITGWPSTLDSPSAAMRALASAPPPGANPCNIVIGRSGHAACAACGKTLLAEKPARSARLLIMAVLLGRPKVAEFQWDVKTLLRNSAQNKPPPHLLLERQPMSRALRRGDEPIRDLRRIDPQIVQESHVLGPDPVRDRRQQMHVQLREKMRRDGDAPGVGERRDLAQVRHAAAHRVGLQDRQAGIDEE